MLGFRKKVTVEEFWRTRLDGMFSGKNQPGWDYLKTSFNDPALSAMEPKVFYANMQAMTLEIVQMVVTKSCPMNASMDSRVFLFEFLKNNNHPNVDSLMGVYNQAFGTSSTDGIEMMARAFSEQASAPLAPETVEGFSRTLYGLAEQMSGLFREIKLVPN